MAAEPTIEFFFDPSCPWTWMTSRWLVDAATQTGRRITWRNLSLRVINAGRDIPEKYRAPMEAAHRAHRIIAAMRADGRDDEIGEYYTEWGRRFHHDRAEPTGELAAEVAAASGAGEWASAADDERWDADIEASTKEGQALAGGSDVGSPIVVAGEPRRGFFGPIVSPPPTGDDAVALLDHVLRIAALPTFYELKRGRQGGPRFGPRP
jgi:2-hydroxychromene-2-carboxylate isomerase